MAEFSLLPDEVERRHHKDNIFTPFSKKRRGTDAMSYCSNGTTGTDPNRRKKLFRAQHTLTQSLTNSDSNLRFVVKIDHFYCSFLFRLMDDQDNSAPFIDKRMSKASLPSDNVSN